MAKLSKRDSMDSGLPNEDSALNSYFEKIDRIVMLSRDCDSGDDPSIDLGEGMDQDIAIRQPSHIQQVKLPRRIDPVVEELRHMLTEFEKKSFYSEKVAKIMLDGLKKDCPFLYKPFIQRELPLNCVPIVAVNNLNTPHIEFLIKAESSDEPPTNRYSAEHLAFSKILIDQLMDRFGPRQSTPKKVPNDSISRRVSRQQRSCRSKNLSYKI